ncbi:hypothetical protein SDC9_199545 [bioreactor metagenome]|uniref:Uncharacterized protein n=1 Tax=bioreactor metagenome TaxID=1076179 RepID=A0A645IKQ8_9ZZZZ
MNVAGDADFQSNAFINDTLGDLGIIVTMVSVSDAGRSEIQGFVDTGWSVAITGMNRQRIACFMVIRE